MKQTKSQSIEVGQGQVTQKLYLILLPFLKPYMCWHKILQVLWEVYHRAGHQPGEVQHGEPLGGDQEEHQGRQIQTQPEQQLRRAPPGLKTSQIPQWGTLYTLFLLPGIHVFDCYWVLKEIAHLLVVCFRKRGTEWRMSIMRRRGTMRTTTEFPTLTLTPRRTPPRCRDLIKTISTLIL